MSTKWKLDQLSYNSNFFKKFIGMPSGERFTKPPETRMVQMSTPRNGKKETRRAWK
jgi:hypothetical protein